MPCSRVEIPGGGFAFVHHGKRRFPKCKFCDRRLAGVAHDGILRNDATLLCDFVIAKTLAGAEITCDAKMCEECAHRVGGKDFCPKHPREPQP